MMGELMDKWAKEHKYEMAKRKLWQSIREEWRVKVGGNQSHYDNLSVAWKAGYDRGFHGNLV